MSTATAPAGGADLALFATLEKSVKDLGEQVNTKLDTFATKKDTEALDTNIRSVQSSLNAIEVKVKARDLDSKYHGLPFHSQFHFFHTLAKAQLGDETAKKAIFGDGGYVKRMDEIAREVYKAPSGFQTQSNEGEIFILPEWSNELLRTPSSRSGIAARARQITMEGQIFRFRALVDKNHSTSVSGGITVSRTPEGGTSTSSTADFEFVELRPNKLTGLCYLTEEALADMSALASLLPGLFMEAFESQDEEDFLFGNGVGKPLGMLSTNNASLITVTRNTAATIKTEDVLKMRARTYGNYSQYVWVASQDIIPALGVLSNANNTLYLPSIKSGEAFDTLLGAPILYSDHVATLGTLNDLSLINPSQYVVANKGGVTQQQSIHVRFLYGETAIRFIKRNDGQPMWRAALQPKKSTQATRSPFITLAT